MGKPAKIKESVFEIKKDVNSTVFADPKVKEREQKKPNKKWKKSLIMAIVCVLIITPFVINKVVNDSKLPGKNIEPISKRSQSVKDENISEKAKTLYGLINHNPTDIEANDEIAANLGVTAYCGKHNIEVYKNDSGYTMRFAFQKPHSTSIDSKFYDLMLNYSIVFMALVDDITEVEWTCPSVESSGTDISEKITFANIREYLGDSPKEYAKSTRTVQFMLNEHGLNDLEDF